MPASLWFRIAVGILILDDARGLGESIDADVSDRDALTIRVYDLTGAPKTTMRSAVAEASRILAVARVATKWEQGDAAAEEAHALDMSGNSAGRQGDTRQYIVVRFVTGTPEGAFRNALGLALPHAEFGSHVTIFYDRVRLLFRMRMGTGAEGVGAVLAHEIGHVLSELNEHSRSGLMKARWSNSDLLLALSGRLHFDRDDVERVQEGARRRLNPLTRAAISNE